MSQQGQDLVKSTPPPSMLSLEGISKCITSGRKPEQRGGHSSVVTQGKLIVFGGHRYEKESKFRYFNDTYVLDVSTLTWKEVLCHGDIIAPRYGHSATLVSKHIA